MTLKEKFDSISCKGCDMPYCDAKCTALSEYELNKLEQIADYYVIEFGKFVLRKYDGKLTTKELLEIFKKEKGL